MPEHGFRAWPGSFSLFLSVSPSGGFQLGYLPLSRSPLFFPSLCPWLKLLPVHQMPLSACLVNTSLSRDHSRISPLTTFQPLPVFYQRTPWTVTFQAPPSMGFSRQEYRSGVPLPSPLLMLFNPSYILIGQKKHSLQFSAFFPSHQQVLFLWIPWNRHWSIGNWTMKQIISFMIIMNYH